MAILQALLAAVARSSGKLLNTVFGWATTMLFGKVPEDRQIYLSGMALGSVVWLVVLVGVAVPRFGVWLLTFVPLPEWVDDGWIRIGMLLAAAVLPALVGILALLMLAPDQRPNDALGRARAVLKGYPYTLGLALTVLLMLLFAPFLKLRSLVRRWTTTHTPVIVEEADYTPVLRRVEEALDAAGWETTARPASWMLRFPTRVLVFFAGGAVERMVASELTTLEAKDLEVTLHPSDLVVSGADPAAARARAILAEQLAFTPAHFTWTREANELEDRLKAVWNALRDGGPGIRTDSARELDAIERDLRQLEIAYEEWEVLFRQKLLVDRNFLLAQADGAARPHEPADRSVPAETPALERVAGSRPKGARPRERRLHPVLTALLTVVALAWGQASRIAGRPAATRQRRRSPG